MLGSPQGILSVLLPNEAACLFLVNPWPYLPLNCSGTSQSLLGTPSPRSSSVIYSLYLLWGLCIEHIVFKNKECIFLKEGAPTNKAKRYFWLKEAKFLSNNVVTLYNSLINSLGGLLTSGRDKKPKWQSKALRKFIQEKSQLITKKT